MTKQTKILIIIIAVLVVAVAIFAVINMSGKDNQKAVYENEEIAIFVGETEHILTKEDMENFGAEEIEVTRNTQHTDDEEVTFIAISFKKICETLEINLDGIEHVQFTAVDGYSSMIKIDDILGDFVYIVTHENGEKLSTKEDGSHGPYMMVTTNSQFSQNWCKFLYSITIE